jgi:DNA-binding NarL/FixJ family response regulator
MRFLIVDDHPILRLGVRQLLAQGWPEAEIVEAHSLAQAEAAVADAERFDLVVLDLSLPDAGGLQAPTRLHQVAPEVPILVLSIHAEPAFAARLLQMGVHGYVAKERAGEELVTAAERALAGRQFVTADMADAVLSLAGDRVGATLPHERLSIQEYRVMCLIGAGRRAAQIAEELKLSPKTVASYRARVFAKGGWGSDVDVMKYCLQHDLLKDV